MAPFLKRTFFLLGGMLLIWESLLRSTGWQAEYAESNLQVNLSRMAEFEFHPVPRDLILGSSLSARLLPAFFAGSGRDVKNLSLDGAGVPMGIELVARRQEKPKRLILEANSLFLRSPGNEQILREAMRNPVFELGRHFFFFRPGSRPSALLYSQLKKLREENDVGAKGFSGVQDGAPRRDASEKDLAALRDLHQQGLEIYLVSVPTGRGEGDLASSWEKEAKEIGARWILPRKFLPQQGIELRYTDGLHLDRASAQLVAKVIVESLPPCPP